MSSPAGFLSCSLLSKNPRPRFKLDLEHGDLNRVRDHLFSYSPLAEYPWRIRWAAGNQIGRVETGTIIVQSAEGLESAFSQITDDIDQAGEPVAHRDI